MPKKRVVRINQGKLLPIGLRLFISGLLFAGMLYANLILEEGVAVLISIFLASPVLPIWNACQIMEINNNTKKYLKGKWLAGFKIGKWKQFKSIREIKIEKSNDNLNPKNRATVKTYAAYMVLEDQGEIYLIGSNSHEQLKKWLKQIYRKLELDNFN